MSQILSPPQRRPDLIGQCESCKTIAIFGEEEQVEFDHTGTYGILVKARCPGSKWCQGGNTWPGRVWVLLHPLNSPEGLALFREIQSVPPDTAQDQATPGLVARISDAWGWFWRKE